MVVYEGVVTQLEEVKKIKEGVSSSGKSWVLWGTNLIVDGEKFGLTGFFKSELEKILKGVSVGNKIKFEYELTDNFKNVNRDSKIEVVEARPVEVKQNGDKPSSEYWDLKDRRISRMSCLNRAIELLKANKEITGDKHNITKEEVVVLASWFENNYVYAD